jgi:hypothetical protein
MTAGCGSNGAQRPLGVEGGWGIVGSGAIGDSSIGSGALPPEGGVSSIGLNLTLSGNGTALYSLTFSCTNGTSTFGGTINFGDAQTIEQLVGGVPDGTGYTCRLTGSDTNNDYCSGTTASFSVIVGQITAVSSTVVCVVPTDASEAAEVCPSGQTPCVTDGSFTCANLQTDVDNCGSCDAPCMSGETCSAGTCVPLPSSEAGDASAE